MAITHDTSFLDTMPGNVARQFLDRVEASRNAEAFRFPVGDAWKSVTWDEVGTHASRLAAGLRSLGIENEDRVGLAASTRYEWIVADFAIILSGAATTTVYPSTNSEGTAYILSDSGSKVVFAEDDTQIAKLVEQRSALPDVVKVVTFDGAADGDWVISLDDLAALGDAYLADKPGLIEEIASSIKPNQLCTLMYTSGTTGMPKGVRLQHRSSVFEGEAIASYKILSNNDLQFLWLPLSHIFGKVLISAQLAVGFPTAIDGRVDKIVDNLAIVKPTFMGAAPRIFEKAYGRIVSMTEAEGGAKEKLFKQAFKVGLEVERRKRDGRSIPLPLKLQHGLFDKLVFAKVRERFGGRVRFFISGSAALNREVAEWFNAAGIKILEGYGMTENFAGATLNHPDDYKFGSVGVPLPGTEIKIAEDGEVLIKGPHVMEGYHNKPDATAETLLDGWLATGDIGEFDADGHLKITDRKKDLFKTSGGKYVAPSSIESQFKAICPFTSNILVHGNERNFVTALITLDPDLIGGWAAENGMGDKSYAEIVSSDEVKAMVAGYVDELNKKLNRWETIKKHVVLDHDLTVESGELTPSLKVKRKVVEGNNKELLDSLYS